MQCYEAGREMMVRVKEGHWKSQFAGMRGTIQKCWGNAGHAAVEVLLEDGCSEIFWLPDLYMVEEDIAI